MKRVVLCFILLAAVFSVTSCGITDKGKKASNEKSIEIIRCFDEKDVEGLKSMFCDEVKNTYNLDEQIKMAFDLYEGTSESYDLTYGGAAGGYDNGVCVDEHITPKIENLKTSTGGLYRIPYHEYVVYKENPKCVGITYIRVFNEVTDEMVQIGEHVY